MSDRLFYTATEAAEILRCDRRTVHRGIADGTIPAVKISDRVVRIPVTAFRAVFQLDAPIATADTAIGLRAVS